MSFTALSDEEERELYRLSRFYWKEALRCEKSKAYLAGSIMLGSALETLLMLMVNCYTEEAEITGKVPTRKGTALPLIDWSLAQLLRVAKHADWLPFGLNSGEDGIEREDWNSRKAKIGDYAEVTRMVRNLVHPGSYLKEHSPSRVTGKYLKRQFEIVELCRDWLVEHNNKSLREHMHKEDFL